MNDVAVKDLGLDIHKQVVKLTKYDSRHGGPYDRGKSDSYYQRGFNPHYFTSGTHNSPMVDKDSMLPDEIIAYSAGYDDNEKAGEFKDWG
tara:strand:+ start:1738 stop:2007 length:270 start_codon:yes stop_codon:yes gene_type:complete